MSLIKRTPTRADGGVTPEEKKKMEAIHKKWVDIAFKTGAANKEALTSAILDLYKVAGLEVPRAVIVPSPLVMAFAYGLSAGWWYCKSNRVTSATRAATDDATADATAAATAAATRTATDEATRTATDAATRTATDEVISNGYKWLQPLALSFAGGDKRVSNLMLSCISKWNKNYHGGNMWAGFLSYAEAMRDVIGLSGLKCWEAYDAWERAGMHGGFRVMHEKFCIVSEFPETIKVNAQNRPHCETGPSHRWRDGFEIYHLNGIRVPKWLVMTDAGKIDPKLALTEKNVDVQREIIRKVGAERMLKATNAKTLDVFMDRHTKGGNEYKLMEMTVGENIRRKYLYFEHASFKGVWYAHPVIPDVKRAIHARGLIIGVQDHTPEGLRAIEQMSDDEIQEALPLEVA